MNLDHLAAVTAQSIVAGFSAANSPGRDKVETVIRKALGVVQESGPTAAILFLYTRSKEEEPASKSLRTQLLGMTTELFAISARPADRAGDALTFLATNVSDQLPRLLLVRQTWEQTLIYARFAAKAML